MRVHEREGDLIFSGRGLGSAFCSVTAFRIPIHRRCVAFSGERHSLNIAVPELHCIIWGMGANAFVRAAIGAYKVVIMSSMTSSIFCVGGRCYWNSA